VNIPERDIAFTKILSRGLKKGIHEFTPNNTKGPWELEMPLKRLGVGLRRRNPKMKLGKIERDSLTTIYLIAVTFRLWTTGVGNRYGSISVFT